MKKISLLLFCVISNTMMQASAFDITTHAVMTVNAVQQSNLGLSPSTSSLIKSLGLRDDETAMGQNYLHMGSPIKVRNLIVEAEATAIELISNASAIPASNTISGWLMRGAIREDDNSVETADSDEPGGVFNRVYGHFYDPVNVRGLTVAGVTLGSLAPDWALAAGGNNTIGSRQNYFQIRHAREAMWRALTLKAYDPASKQIQGDAEDPQGLTPADDKEAARKAYWATTFRALGDVVHLLQDMAQPQHTRNDPHSGFGCIAGACAAGHASFLEYYLAARTTQAPSFTLVERTDPYTGFVTNREPFRTTRPQLDYCCYTKPQFTSYDAFFSTETGSANASGKGIANYSSRGFYSFGTNINNTTLPSPPPTGAGLGFDKVLDGLVDMQGSKIEGTTVFRTGTVKDSIGGGDAVDVRLSTVGAWDDALQQKNPAFSSYSLNYYNYDAQAALLIPRAVAYSAGLIDYFFRGQLEITPPDEGIYSIVDHYDFAGDGKTPTDAENGFKGFKTIKLKLRNTTPSINPSGGGEEEKQGMVSGKLVAVLKFHRNKKYVDDLSGEPTEKTGSAAYTDNRSATEEIIVSSRVKDQDGTELPTITLSTGPLAPAKLLYFEFDKELPINATDVILQVVYRGNLGSEADAVVVQTIDLSEPTYLAYMNATDYFRIGSHVYTKDEINASTPAGADLRSKVQPRGCITTSDQLSSFCSASAVVNEPMTFGTPTDPTLNNTVATILLPNTGTFSRMAMLLPGRGQATIDQSNFTTCLPHEPIPVYARVEQIYYVPYEDPQASLFEAPVRGVSGDPVSCVKAGDGNLPGTSDDRNTKMAPLTDTNLKPKQLNNFKFGPP